MLFSAVVGVRGRFRPVRKKGPLDVGWAGRPVGFKQICDVAAQEGLVLDQAFKSDGVVCGILSTSARPLLSDRKPTLHKNYLFKWKSNMKLNHRLTSKTDSCVVTLSFAANE